MYAFEYIYAGVCLEDRGEHRLSSSIIFPPNLCVWYMCVCSVLCLCSGVCVCVCVMWYSIA